MLGLGSNLHEIHRNYPSTTALAEDADTGGGGGEGGGDDDDDDDDHHSDVVERW